MNKNVCATLTQLGANPQVQIEEERLEVENIGGKLSWWKNWQ